MAARDVAKDTLRKLENDAEAFTPGRTNDDVVNSMIACEVLAMEWFNWARSIPGLKIDYRILEHAKRIVPYLKKWFSNGPEEALNYMV